jgi:hypothetical protein
VIALDDVYRKFGETAEAAQLLETELGNLRLDIDIEDEGLAKNLNPQRAAELVEKVNRQTLGQLLKGLNSNSQSLAVLEALLATALVERNRLSHSFYREHNFRRNSSEGRALMLADLDSIHNAILDAYKAVLLLSGIDIENAADGPLPTDHLPL